MVDEVAGSLARSYIAHDDVHVGEMLLDSLQRADDTLAVAVGRVDDDGIYARVDQCLCTLQRVGGHAHACGHAQAALGVLASHRLVLGLGDILIGDEADEVVVLIDHRELLDLVLLEDGGSGLEVRLLMRGDEVLGRHDLRHLLVEVGLEAQVAVGDDTDEVALVIDDRDAADMVVVHHLQRV